jgi:hypothetical protein
VFKHGYVIYKQVLEGVPAKIKEVFLLVIRNTVM